MSKLLISKGLGSSAGADACCSSRGSVKNKRNGQVVLKVLLIHVKGMCDQTVSQQWGSITPYLCVKASGISVR